MKVHNVTFSCFTFKIFQILYIVQNFHIVHILHILHIVHIIHILHNSRFIFKFFSHCLHCLHHSYFTFSHFSQCSYCLHCTYFTFHISHFTLFTLYFMFHISSFFTLFTFFALISSVTYILTHFEGYSILKHILYQFVLQKITNSQASPQTLLNKWRQCSSNLLFKYYFQKLTHCVNRNIKIITKIRNPRKEVIF